MNLTKALRENGRTYLMVAMAFLLVAWLMPQQFQGCNSEGRALRALRQGEAYGESISSEQVSRCASELSLLESLNIPATQVTSGPLEYYLLRAEARESGVRVSREEAVDLLRARGITDERLRAVQESHRIDYHEIYRMVEDIISVFRMQRYQADGIFDSLPREALNFRNSRQNAVAKISTIEVRAFDRLAPEPTEEQLQAFFAECKDRTTAHTADELVFGYKRPDRVKVEYLTVDPAKVKARVQVRMQQVEKYFADNRKLYMKPDPSATQPAEGQPPPQIEMTFEEARDRAREDLRDQKAVEEASRVINDLRDELARPWMGAELDEQGFVKTPPAVESLEALAAKHAEQGVERHVTDLVDLPGLSRVPGLGQAQLSDRQRVSGAQLAFRVKGLYTPPEGEHQDVLVVNQPSPVLMSRQTNPMTRVATPRQPFVFRVIEVAPSAPPASLDEVRDQVVKDWKQVQALKLAKAAAEKLTARAKEVGLTTAVTEDTELRELLAASEVAATQPAGSSPVTPRYVGALEPFTPGRLTRMSPFIEQVGMVPGVAKAIFALNDDLSDPTTRPAHPIASVTVASQNKCIVAELVEIQPLYMGEFEAQLAQSQQQSQQMAQRRFLMEWHARQNVEARTGFVAAPAPAPAPKNQQQ